VNRVRVSFPWQGEDSTPWIPFAAKGDGKPSTGRHNKGTNVMVGFVDGNVERPYVMGAIQDTAPYDGTVDIDLTTPNEHYMRLTDATNKGVHKMALSILSPTMSGLWSAIPGLRDYKIPDIDETNTPYLDGGFTLSDYYGMYKISGSSIGRNISISSPFGDVKMNAFTGITISAPNGDVKIKGKNVTIEAGNNLKLTSGTNIKKYLVKTPESAWAVLDPLTTAAERLLKEVGGIIDFTFLRHVAEIQAKPKEGVTEIKSNRYLKLESGGSSTGYPDAAYKDDRTAYSDVKGVEWYTMGAGISALIGEMNKFTNSWLALHKKRYKAAQDAKASFEQSVNKLRRYSNYSDQELDVENNKVCKGYSDLKAKFCNLDTKKITVEDLGFVKNKVGTTVDAEVTPVCKARCRKSEIKVRARRAELSVDVLRKANALLGAVQAIKRMELTDEEIDSELGSRYDKKHYLPKNYMNAVKKAFSKEKCSKSSIYTNFSELQFDLTNEEYTNLGNPENRKKLVLNRLVALNLLEEFGFAAMKKIPGTNPVQYDPITTALHDLFANENELINKWQQTIDSIMLCNTSGGYEVATNFVQDAIYSKIDELTFKQVSESDVWSDAKSGKILFSSGGNPQYLDGTMKDLNVKCGKGKLDLSDALDRELQEYERFNRTIKNTLNSFNIPVEANVEVVQEEQQPQNQNIGNLNEPVPQVEQGNVDANNNNNQNNNANPQNNEIANPVELGGNPLINNFIDDDDIPELPEDNLADMEKQLPK
jgi:prepilin-type processing-associated H-X9-DG protein